MRSRVAATAETVSERYRCTGTIQVGSTEVEVAKRVMSGTPLAVTKAAARAPTLGLGGSLSWEIRPGSQAWQEEEH
jgi:hypothetical protein